MFNVNEVSFTSLTIKISNNSYYYHFWQTKLKHFTLWFLKQIHINFDSHCSCSKRSDFLAQPNPSLPSTFGLWFYSVWSLKQQLILKLVYLITCFVIIIHSWSRTIFSFETSIVSDVVAVLLWSNHCNNIHSWWKNKKSQ